MTTLAAMRDALTAHAAADLLAAEQLADLTPTPAPVPFAQLPPATAHHGPGAARTVAQQLADTGAHSHLVADGQTMCLTGGCNRPRTPAEVLL